MDPAGVQLEQLLARLADGEISMFECRFVDSGTEGSVSPYYSQSLSQLLQSHPRKSPPPRDSALRSPVPSSPNRSYFLRSGKSPQASRFPPPETADPASLKRQDLETSSSKKQPPRNPDFSGLAGFLRENEAEFAAEELAAFGFSLRSGETAFLETLNATLGRSASDPGLREDCIIILKAQLELRFYQSLEQLLEKAEIAELTRLLAKSELQAILKVPEGRPDVILE